MDLGDFIEEHMAAILAEWEEFAASLHPAATGMSSTALRDWAEEMLRSIVHDMATEQTEEERYLKSRGEAPGHRPRVAYAAETHAEGRLAEGFTLNQVAAEFRALRATVIHQWREHLHSAGEKDLEDLTRFNEAIDQSLTRSIHWYNDRVESARDLLNGVLAHDLRVPLAAVSMSADVLLQGASLDARQAALVVRIQNSSRRAQTMVDDLLDFTRTRLGTGLPVTPTDADIGQLCRAIIDELRASDPGASITLATSGDLTGRWDVSRTSQMLSNLAGNAIQHGAHGGTVTVSARADGDSVSVEIHNEGVITPEHTKVIFEPFRRVSGSDSRQGSEPGLGLGLYIARQIAEAHGGTIDVASSAARGTSFTVRLPRRHAQDAEVAGVT